MINLLLKVLMVLSGTLMYIHGETSDGWASKMGKSNKQFKYWMGVPIALLGCCMQPFHIINLLALLCIPTYWLACNAGYGEDNWITKLIGKTGAIVFHGTLVGLASYPLLGLWCMLSGILSGVGFWAIYQGDTDGKIKEPEVALLRGAVGTIFLLGA